MFTEIITFLLLTAKTWSESETVPERRATDLVLDCWLVEEGASRSSGLGALFSRVKSLLVIRNVSVSEDSSTQSWTDFEFREVDGEKIIFEAEGSGTPIPEGEAILHADCAGEPLECEIGAIDREGTPGRRFLATLHFPTSKLGITLVLGQQQTPSEVVRESGTIPVTVEFLVYTRTSTIRTRLGKSIFIHCEQGGLDNGEISVEWRMRHEGSGRRVHTLEARQGVSESEGASMDVEKAVSDGDFSLRLDRISIQEEGTYICTVSGVKGQAQQTSVVQILEPPEVRVRSEYSARGHTPGWSLVCDVSRFYPLSIEIAWFREDDLAVPLSPVTFSSHLQNRDGTFNLSAEVRVKELPDADPLPVYTCRVSHLALDAPVSVSAELELQKDFPGSSLTFLYQGILAMILLCLTVTYIRRNYRKPDLSDIPERNKGKFE